jgi:hypothetical protein
MAEYEYIGDGRPDGTVFIRTSTEKGAFYGSTPVVQPSSASQAAVTATVTTTATTTALATDVAALIVLTNQLRSELVTLGLISGAA